jgi:ATP-dependent helicase HrpB
VELHYPVLDCLPELRLQLQGYPVVILQAPPGAGKSTIVPLQFINSPVLGGKKIVMLEPRRLAARSVAMRMASLLDEEIGERVGYRIRFESRVGKNTLVEVVTEGILTRMLQADNALSEVGLVIFDEFHERSLQADLALALCLQVQNILRPDLRILIMSATVDAQALSSQLNNAPVVSSAGKTYPVEIVYLGDDRNTHLPVRMQKAIQLAVKENAGDILCFLPGTGEIRQTAQLLEALQLPAVVIPLYGDLPFTAQQQAIMPDEQGRRKIVLATSIAETSLTIDGITTVIDSGYSRVPRFDPRSGLTRLETIRVTKDAAAQRTGRAGRLGPGICYRLWSEAAHRYLADERKPEILEADLAGMLLELSAWGIHNPTELKWITPPPAGAISQANDLLIQLGARHQNRITALGKKMVLLPTHPRIAHMLVAAEPDSNLMALATDVAALLEERDPLANQTSADLSLRVDVLRKWRSGERIMADQGALERIERLARAWRKIFSLGADNSTGSDYQVGELLAMAYPERIAQRTEKNNERYKLANGRVARLSAHDPLMHSEWIAVAHVDAGSGEGKIFLAAPIHESDLTQYASPVEVVRWDRDRGTVIGVEEMRIGSLVLSKKPLAKIPEAMRMEVICRALQDEGLNLLNWQESHTHWQNRVLSLRAWRPGENWPDVSHTQLMKTVQDWLTPFLVDVNNRQDLQRLNLQAMLDGLLPWELRSQLNYLAPPRLEVPSGSMIQVNYFTDGKPPVMEVRLQEVFGLPDTPTVNEGRIKVTMHLLSPGYKPVQVTQDLKSFWNSTYHEVKKELKRRYPKHSWPDDPWTAKAVRGVVKRRPV